MKTLAGGPKTQAHAVRIWAYCEKRNWDVSYEDVSRALGLSVNVIHSVISKNKWGGRISERRRNVISNQATHERGHRANINLIPLDILIRG